MLEEADVGIFYCAPDNVLAEFPQNQSTTNYEQLKQAITEAMNGF